MCAYTCKMHICVVMLEFGMYECVCWFLDVWELNGWILGKELEYLKPEVSH